MNPISKMKMGSAITKLANLFEELQQLRQTYPTGSIFELMGETGKNNFNYHYLTQSSKLSKYPPYEVSKAIFGHLQLNQRLGRELRLIAIENLFESLVSKKIALGIDEYENAHLGSGY